MFLNIISSILIGSIFGLSYGFIFYKKMENLWLSSKKVLDKKLDSKNFKKQKYKTIAAKTLLNLLSYTLLLLFLVFLIIKFEFNIPAVIISLLFFFWIYILKAKK